MADFQQAAGNAPSYTCPSGDGLKIRPLADSTVNRLLYFVNIQRFYNEKQLSSGKEKTLAAVPGFGVLFTAVQNVF